ncbi:hypothetical protein CALCODRAFT_497586, partial [Calocera cornea HHB12733]
MARRMRRAADLLSDVEGHWFPRLHSVRLHRLGTAEQLLTSSRFIVPTVESICIIAWEPENAYGDPTWSSAIAALERRITTTPRKIRAFSLTRITQHNPLLERILLEVTRKFSLRSLHTAPPLFTELVATQVSQASKLQQLSVEEANNDDSTMSSTFFATPNSILFSSLRDLKITGRPIVLLNALSSLDATLLKLTLTSMGPSDVNSAGITRSYCRKLACCISHRYPGLHELHLCDAAVGNDHDVLWMRDLEPLSKCTSLQKFSIKRFWAVIRNEDLGTLTRKWLLLRTLVLLHLVHAPPEVPDNFVSWEGLIALRRHCPELTEVSINRFNPAPPIPRPPEPSPQLSTMLLAFEDPRSNMFPRQTAQFLSLLWPSIRLSVQYDDNPTDEWKEVVSLLAFRC